MKKVLSIVLALAMLFALTACGKAGSDNSAPPENSDAVANTDAAGNNEVPGGEAELKSFSIGYFDDGSTDGTTQPVIAQLKTAIEALGGTGVPVAPANSSPDAQVEALEILLTKDVDGVVLPYALFGEASLPVVVTKCQSAGVYFGFYWAEEEYAAEVEDMLNGCEYYVGRLFQDDKVAAYDGMKALSDSGCKNVGFIGIPAVEVKENSRDNGVTVACSELGMKVLVEQRDIGFTLSAEGGAATVEQFLTAYPDMDGIIICGMAQFVLPGVMQSLTTLNRNDIKVACIDFCNDMDVYAKDGRLVYECGGHNNGGAYLTILMANIFNGTPIHDGPVLLGERYIQLYSVEDFEAYKTIQGKDSYNAEEIRQCLKALNSDFSYEQFEKMVGSYSLEDIQQRHG